MSSQKSEHHQNGSQNGIHNGIHNGNLKRQGTVTLDPLSAAKVYYGESHSRKDRVRTYSSVIQSAARSTEWLGHDFKQPARRSSHDEQPSVPRKFIIPVEDTLKRLLEREDTDGNEQITIEDMGPKVLSIGTAASGGYNRYDLRGNYSLSNLLQELYLARYHQRKTVILDEVRLNENPVSRLSRLIKHEFWPNLTRTIDAKNIHVVAEDKKDWTGEPRPRVYIPQGAPEQYEYYSKIAKAKPELKMEVLWLDNPPDDPEYVRKLKPGLLAVAMKEVLDENGKKTLEGLPFVVPGGRFNELYGWDSYMESLGLLIHDRVDLVKPMVQHFCFCIRHYGKILNANRTYYLCRSQPPFLTDMALRCYEKIRHEEGALDFLREAMYAAIKEYYTVWMSEPRYDPKTGLSRYRPGGAGIPPETEASHFNHVIEQTIEKENITIKTSDGQNKVPTISEFIDGYNNGTITSKLLNEYFLHDRAVRESGHDTSYRLEGVAAYLATVDLNSLLYKYETDISRTIRTFFNDQLEVPDHWRAEGHAIIERSADWDRRARKRRLVMDKLLWDEDRDMYVDWNTVTHKREEYECATTFWPMWAGLATPRQASVLVQQALPKLEAFGGLLSGSEQSLFKIALDKPNRQWDHPYGWAPQQMLAWVGLQRYGFEEEAQRLCYKWLFMVTKAFVDFNGVVVEKYDVTRKMDPHKVEAEYGNQGSDFKGVATEGFGWVNASYVLGMTIVNAHQRRALGALTDWDTYLKATKDSGLDDMEEFL